MIRHLDGITAGRNHSTSFFGSGSQNPAIPVEDGHIYSVYDPDYGIYAGEVLVTISDDGLMITNTTIDFEHVLANGKVVRSAIPNPDGSWSVVTHGYGNNVLPGMNIANDIRGPEIFNTMDERMRRNIELHHHGWGTGYGY